MSNGYSKHAQLGEHRTSQVLEGQGRISKEVHPSRDPKRQILSE